VLVGDLDFRWRVIDQGLSREEEEEEEGSFLVSTWQREANKSRRRPPSAPRGRPFNGAASYR